MRNISFTLDTRSINKALNELKRYTEELPAKCEQLRRMVAERIRWSAQNGFSNAIVSDTFGGTEAPPADVKVSVEDGEHLTVVFAEGEEAVFIEFGAGVYHNGAAGSSPHPWGAERGYLIGEYGQGKGKRKGWAFRTSGGEVVKTHGTPAAMPMYRGLQEAIQAMDSMIGEVFG